nr:hypothetical protein CFP56_59815 [Quercus suber]
MAEELEAMWSKLSVTEEEGEGIDLGSNSTRAAKEVGKNCVIMKIMTLKSTSLDTLRKNLRMLWKTNKWVNFSELEAELFLVEFGDGKDKKKVLNMSPWSFEKQLVILQEFEGEQTPKEMELKWSPFWIQIFNLPLMSRTKETGWAIGTSLGAVMEVDVPDSGVHWGKRLRVRVRIDASKNSSVEKESPLKGVSPDCPASSVGGRTVEEGFQYGAWLRGDPYGRTQKEPVKYSGGENHGSRDGVTGVRLERTLVQSDLPGEKPVVGGNHVPVSLPLGSSSLTRDDVILEAPRQLTATPQEEGKGEGCEEDIPPGFEGQHLKDTIVTEVFDKFEGYKGICECVDKINPEIISSPSKKPNGPSLDAKRANLFSGSSELG